MTLIFRSFFASMNNMIFAELKFLQIIFLILVPIAVITLVVCFIVVPVNKSHIKNNFKEYCYKAIYRIAFDEDYYLINEYLFRMDPSKVAKIDHILFGNKYIYVILDTYYEGDLIGKETDESLILVNNRGKKYYTENQYSVAKALIKALSIQTGIEEGMFIGIVVVNNNCKLGIETNSKQYYLIQRNKVKKLVKAIESRNVGNINAQQLEAAVKAIDKSNRKKKK